jgi:hypothetical protein
MGIRDVVANSTSNQPGNEGDRSSLDEFSDEMDEAVGGAPNDDTEDDETPEEGEG